MVILVFYFRSYLIVLEAHYFRFFQNLAKLQFTVWAPEAPGALWTPWVPESTWAPWSFHAGVDDVDKKVDKEGAIVLMDSRLYEDTFMIYWREKQTNVSSVIVNASI